MSGTIQNLKQMMSMVQNAGNPQAMLNNIVAQNSQMKQVMTYVQQHGGDPKKAFYDMAEQQGIDPEQVLAMLK